MDFDDLYGTRRVLDAIAQLSTKVEALQMTYQEDVDALTGILNDVKEQTSVLVTDVTAIAAKLAAGETLDTTALDALVENARGVQSALDSAVGSVTALAAPAEPPAEPTA